MFALVKGDINRAIGSEKKTLSKIGVILFNPGLHAVCLYRLSRWLYIYHMQPLAFIVSYLSFALTGSQISPRASVGAGLTIYHPQGTVIGATAVIGSNCTLTHGNVIGQAYGGGDRPTIGDNFYAGTGAKMIGQIAIGNNVRIGANVVVVTSLPDGVTVPPITAKVKLGAVSDRSITAGPSLTRESIEQRLVALLKSTLILQNGTGSINGSTGLLGEGIGVDSLELLKLIAAVEQEFTLTIDETELQISDFRTVGSLVTFLEKRVSS